MGSTSGSNPQHPQSPEEGKTNRAIAIPFRFLVTTPTSDSFLALPKAPCRVQTILFLNGRRGKKGAAQIELRRATIYRRVLRRVVIRTLRHQRASDDACAQRQALRPTRCPGRRWSLVREQPSAANNRDSRRRHRYHISRNTPVLVRPVVNANAVPGCRAESSGCS